MSKKRVTYHGPVYNGPVHNNWYVAPAPYYPPPRPRTKNKLLVFAIIVIVIVMLAPDAVLPWSPIAIWAYVYLCYRLAKPTVAAARKRAEIERQRRTELAARADREHAQVMRGDPAGVYGQYVPAETEERMAKSEDFDG